jgi:two-component system, OmpR family, response regulator
VRMPLTSSTPALTRPDGSPLRVLVVDDEADIAELISMAVRYEGWRPTVASNGSRAVSVAKELRPDAVACPPSRSTGRLSR